jgi:hypothetical protein
MPKSAFRTLKVDNQASKSVQRYKVPILELRHEDNLLNFKPNLKTAATAGQAPYHAK